MCHWKFPPQLYTQSCRQTPDPHRAAPIAVCRQSIRIPGIETAMKSQGLCLLVLLAAGLTIVSSGEDKICPASGQVRSLRSSST